MSQSRFTPNNFQYNGPIAVALTPCLVVAAAIGGKPVMATLAIGSMISYMMDTLQYREGAFTCAWITLGTSQLSFLLSLLFTSEADLPLILALAVSMSASAALVGMWVSLQFKWIQMQYPAVAIMFERILITGAIPLASIMHTLALALVVEAADVPFFLAASMCLLYFLLGRPLTSSFSNSKAGPPSIGGGRASKASVVGPTGVSAAQIASAVQSRFDAFLLALLTISVPSLAYMAIHWTVMFCHAVHMYSILLLASSTAVFICLIPQGLWWLPGPRRLVLLLRLFLLASALVAFMVGFEGRVVFYAFRQYIKLHPPWDWLAVTAALLGLGAAALAHQGGLFGQTVDVAVAGIIMLLCTTAGSLAVGVPLMWLPAPLVATCGLALYYDTGSLREYAVFVGGAVATSIWFVRQNFWFLDILVGTSHLHLLCKLLLVAMVPALMVPGLMAARASRTAIGALLMLQASLLCVLEEKLYAPYHQDDLAGEVMYPAYLVLATSGAAIAATRCLASEGQLPPSASWVLHSLHLAKLAMLVLPEAFLVLPTAVLLLAVLAPAFIYELDIPSAASGPARQRRLRLMPWQGLLHVMSVLLAVVMARFAVFDLVQFLSSSRPTEGVLLGTLLLVTAAGLLPLVWRCYPANQIATRLIALIVMAGALLIFLQPPMPLRGGARCPKLPLSLCPRLWDERHIPMHGTEDVEVWGRGLARKEHWPRWLLLAACMLGASAAALGGSATKRVSARLGLATASGLLVGGFLALEVVPRQEVLQGLIVASCLVVVLFTVLLQSSVAKIPGLMPVVFAAWLLLLGSTMLLHTELPMPDLPAAARRLFPDSKVEVDREVWMTTRASLMGVFAAHALLMAFTLKLKAGSVLRQMEGKVSPDGHDASLYSLSEQYMSGAADLFCGIMPSRVFSRFSTLLQVRGSGNVALQILSREGLLWIPCVGNVCTFIVFNLALALNTFITGGVPEAIFMLAPLLLLLSQDPLFLPELEDKQRYVPPAAVVSLYLAASGLLRELEVVSEQGGQAGSLRLLKGVLLIAAALPSHVQFITWLWSQKARSAGSVLMTAPLNILPILFASGALYRYLGFLGLLMGLTQYYAMKHIRNVSFKII